MSVRDVEILLGLLVAVAVLVTISRKTAIPYPVFLVLGGLALALVPGLPTIALRPDLVFLVFLPPLLYRESLNSPWRGFRRKARPIFSLAVGLVLATASVVAVVAHALIPGMTWPAAFVLGSVLAPTDEVAVTEVADRLAVPHQALTVLEGESLVNDAISLVIYRLAIVATVTGAFSLPRAIMQFFWVALGGVAIGLGVGWLVGRLRRRLHDPPVENTVSLLTPFAAYLPADAIGVSGVLSVVTIGLYLGWQGPRIVSSRTRLEAQAMWGMIAFLLNGLLFILTGLQLKEILHSGAPLPLLQIFGYTAVFIATLIAVRFAWVFANAYGFAWLSSRRRGRVAAPSWRQTFLVAWVGVRGGLSLVAALAIPFTLAGGIPFPNRNLMIGLAFYVILGTLLLQGMTLPWLLRWLNIPADGFMEREEAQARLAAARAGLERLDALIASHRPGRDRSRSRDVPHEELSPEDLKAAMIDDLREHYIERMHRYHARARGDGDNPHETSRTAYHRLRRELLRTERDKILQLRDEGVISDDTQRRIQQDLDLEELRLDPEEEEEAAEEKPGREQTAG